MKIALAQMRVIPGNAKKNLAVMMSMIEKAKQQQVGLLAFPELCISGYLVSDAWLSPSFREEMLQYNEAIREASEGIAIVFGNIYEDSSINHRWCDAVPHPNKDGRPRLYNAAIAVQNQQWVSRLNDNGLLPAGVQPKTLLPNYRFFDDQRYFFSLPDLALDAGEELTSFAQPFLIEGLEENVPIGVQVCEDLWCQDYRFNKRALNISRLLVKNGAQAIVNISASPWTHHKHDARDRRIQFLAGDAQNEFVPFYYVNSVGPQNNGKNIITFDGGSTVYNANGQALLRSDKSFEEELLVADHANTPCPKIKQEEPEKIAQKYKAVSSGIAYLKDMLGWQNHPKFVVGVSGGIDSALVVTLLAKTLGPDSVWAVNMPTRFNSQATQNVAAHLSNKLGIEYLQVPIEELAEQQISLFSELDNRFDATDTAKSLSNENIQAKIRGTSILSNLAGRYGRMFTNNGNKVEIALGYATLYGDVGGVIAPIGDLTKAEVYDMARYLNNDIYQDEIIPESLFPNDLFEFSEGSIAPSAELREEQVDPMKFGYHCALLDACTSFKKVGPEQVMEWYLAGTMEANLGISNALLVRWGIDDPKTFIEDITWFYRCIQQSVFKRIQAPPIIITSPSAYGYDIRESQLPYIETIKFQGLKDKVLQLERYTQHLD